MFREVFTEEKIGMWALKGKVKAREAEGRTRACGQMPERGPWRGQRGA